jgi:hypothetical protein
MSMLKNGARRAAGLCVAGFVVADAASADDFVRPVSPSDGTPAVGGLAVDSALSDGPADIGGAAGSP